MVDMSVIIPVYNSEKFLRETLDNVLAQSLESIEIIIINDGSVDSSQEIIDEYCKKHGNIKAFYQKNAGVSAARNNGLEKATGKYVVFLDADDYYSEASLEGFYNAGEKSGADIILGRLRMFDEKGMFPFHVYADKAARQEKIKGNSKDLLWNFLVGNKCYRRERLVQSGVRFPAYKYCEEGAFFMAYVFTGATVSGTEDSISYYRRHTPQQGLSVSQSVSEELARSFSAALEEIYNGAISAEGFFENQQEKEEYIQELLYKTAHILLSQFYRLLWHGDEGCPEFLSERFSELAELMTEETLEKIKRENSDLIFPVLPGSRKAVWENAKISVVINKGKNLRELFHSVYDQTFPFFEVIVPKALAESGEIPEEYIKSENLVVLPDENFCKEAKKIAKGRIIKASGKTVFDIRLFRMFFRLPVPDFIKSLCFSPVIKILNFVLRNIKK